MTIVCLAGVHMGLILTMAFNILKVTVKDQEVDTIYDSLDTIKSKAETTLLDSSTFNGPY